MKYRKVRIESDGFTTHIWVDGVEKQNVKEIDFHAEAGNAAECIIKEDVMIRELSEQELDELAGK